jgi:hypothetical protein
MPGPGPAKVYPRRTAHVQARAADPDPVTLKWVDGSAPAQIPIGTAFGVPWKQGAVDKTTPFFATDGTTTGVLPLQTWPMAL